ncbi:MAG: tetratricopeptide repeat protein, partial [Ignavibacteria bacterium]|nr:tetratricopeptide repeat protein [Ignavibacteria bacterium]
QKKYKQAIEGYFDVIIDYPASVAASDAYYYLANHYETIENSYLKALVNYKKSTEENPSSDFLFLSRKKTDVFSRYFSLHEKIDTAFNVTIPTVNKELEKRRVIRNEEKGIIPNKFDDQNPPPNGRENGKGSGVRSADFTYTDFKDSIKENDARKKKKDEAINNKSEDTLTTQDEIINNETPIDTSSIRRAHDEKFNSYYELAELFLYDLKRVDSSVYYLKVILDKFSDEDKKSRTLYTLATIYANNNEADKANELYRELIQNYPNTIFANESRKILGITTIELEEETVKEIYKDAEKKLLAGASRDAITILTNLKDRYPESELLPKTYYTLGWIYENVYRNKDSVIFYYRTVADKYPNSEYAQRIKDKLELLDVKIGTDTTGKKVLLDSTGAKLPLDSNNVNNTNPEQSKENQGDLTNPKEQEPTLDDQFKGKTQEEIIKILQEEEKKNLEEENKKNQEQPPVIKEQEPPK